MCSYKHTVDGVHAHRIHKGIEGYCTEGNFLIVETFALFVEPLKFEWLMRPCVTVDMGVVSTQSRQEN